MKRSIISAVAAVVTSLALSACGAGLDAQTAEMVAPVPGVSINAPGKDGLGTVSLRNAALVYPGPQGYKSGSEATAHAWLFNDTPVEQIVVIKYNDQEVKRVTVASGKYSREELKFRLTEDVGTEKSVQVVFEWVGVDTMRPMLPIAPPDAPLPAEKVELPAESGGEGH